MFYSIGPSGGENALRSQNGATSFSNSDIGAMRSALDAAMAALDKAASPLVAHEVRDATKERVAVAIIDIAADGERDPNRLAHLAIMAVVQQH